MIVVLADDLSGAAELAGRAFEYGLTAEVQTVFDASSQADVIAVDAATRSLSQTDAAVRAGEIARHVAAARPQMIFKKIDSVLRGWVRAEAKAVMEATGQSQAVIVPANPTRQRVIHAGIYYVNDVPLDRTVFARDPEHPRTTAVAADLLPQVDPADKLPLVSLGRPARLPGRGLTIADAANDADLHHWADCLSPDVLAVGGVDFFGAVIERWVTRQPRQTELSFEQTPTAKTLFVCGSAAAWDSHRAQQALQRGVAVEAFPSNLFRPGDISNAVDAWTQHLVDRLDHTSALMVAIGRAVDPSPVPATSLVERLGAVVERLLSKVRFDRVCIEGGATATQVFHRQHIDRLIVEASLGPGIIALRLPQDLQRRWVLKPGSYEWPETIWPADSSSLTATVKAYQ